MKSFKFLTHKRPVFQFEVLRKIQYHPTTLIHNETWSLERTLAIKYWLSDYFFGTHPNGFDKTKYFPQLDRTCRIIQTGLDYTEYHEHFFSAIIEIRKSHHEYMEVELHYPTAHIQYV